MTRLLLAILLVPASIALAKDTTATGSEATRSEDIMSGWVPPRLTNPAQSKKEIQALMQAMDAANKRGDVDAAAALVDFPVLMATDNSKGEGMAETWDREKWVQMMSPFYAKPMADVKVKHKPNIFLLSDSLASVDDVATVTAGPKTMTMRNTTLVVRREGKWLVKAMAEGGWGDVMGPRLESAGAATPGAPSQGTGSGAMGTEGGAQGTGSGSQDTGAQGAGSPGAERGAQQPPSHGDAHSH